MPDEQTTLPVGTLLRERYLVKSVLGSGNAGTVYLVKDQQAKDIKYQLFALKEITGLDQQARYQFTFNGITLRQIQHPVLPRIQHIFNDDKRNCVYLVTDYIEGTNLEALGRQQPTGRLRWSELRVLCEPLVGALTYLHRQEKPLFHGDIRPTNVIQGITRKIMLVDLGYAQAAPPERLMHLSAGIASNYQAPEQFAGRIDELSDIYALAATLYASLTGQVPVDALTRRERIDRRKADPLVLASKVAPGVPRPLAEALQRALSLDPVARFPSIREFWQTLSSLPIPDEVPAAVPGKQKTPLFVPETPMIAATPLIVESSGAARNTRKLRAQKRRRLFLPGVAILCALSLILLGAGTWVWATTHGYFPTSLAPTRQAGTGGPLNSGSATPTASSDKYTSVLGRYRGNFTLDGKVLTFTVSITHQVQNQFSGTFDSPQQSGTLMGSIDAANDLQWTVINDSNDAILGFTGGLNGILNTTDSMGGTLYKCLPGQGPNCEENQAPGSGGYWALSFVHSAFVPPTSILS